MTPENDFDHLDHDRHDREKKLEIIAESFVNRNANVVPLHRKNKAPACGRKISHVWPQKNDH